VCAGLEAAQYARGISGWQVRQKLVMRCPAVISLIVEPQRGHG
jgi:hypothetical protein